MSVIDKIKDSDIGKGVRNTMVGIAATVASMGPVQAQEQKESGNDKTPEKTEVRAETAQTHEDTANTINFADVVNEQMNANAQAWEVSDTAAPQADTVQTPVEEQMEIVDRLEEREVISTILDARGIDHYLDDFDIKRMAASGETTKEDDTQDAKEGMRIWNETGRPQVSTFEYIGDQYGYYSPGDDGINVMETVSEEQAQAMTANIRDEDERNCRIDDITFKPMSDFIINHEGHHMKNDAVGVYAATSDTTWTGCEATAKAEVANEIGARIAELNFVRDTYIKAGGGEAGLAALRELGGINSHNAMINGYIYMIETGQVDPFSTNPEDQKKEFAAMGKLAYERWKEHDEHGYVPQIVHAALREAISNHLPNVKKDEQEEKRRCDMAMTLNVTTPNGGKQEVNFGQYVQDITLPNNVQMITSTLDNNPDLVAEYAQNGSQAFRDKTERMQRTVDASRGNIAQNNNKDQDKVQTHTQTHAQTNKQDRSAMIQGALNRSLGR